MITILLALLLLLAPPDPQLHARLDSPGAATVAWTQTQRGCLYHNQDFVSCFEVPGRYRVTFGHTGPISGELRPKAGDVYVLVTGGQTWRARLAWWVYLGVVRR